MKSRKKTLLKSALALVLCVSMLVGSTFAWFTDRVSNSGNIITSGNLDLEMYWTDDLASGNWYNVEEDAYNTIFSYENWEPGYTDVKYIKLVNAGNLALNYDLSVEAQNGVGKLAEVISVYFGEGEIALTDRTGLDQLSCVGFLNNVMNGGATASGTLLPANEQSPLHPSGEVVMTVAMSMITSAGNEYQNESSGDFTVRALATQASYESDSFGSDYDASAELPTVLRPGSVSAPVTAENGKVPAGGVSMAGDGLSAFVPEGTVLADGADKLTLTVTPMEDTTSGIVAVNDEILIPVDVHIEGVAEDNNIPIIIDLGEVLPKSLNMGNYYLIHVEDGVNNTMTLVADRNQLNAHNQFTYDPATGAVSVAMASFSEVAIVSDSLPKWEGKADHSWYVGKSSPYTILNADQLWSFSQIVGGMAEGIEQDSFENKVVTLASDINLADGEKAGTYNDSSKIFYPIGYNSSDGKYEKTGVAITSGFYNFAGTFDGTGHYIANFYQNTWEMKGDNEYYAASEQCYRDGMGLFGRVYGATIKNLTVKNFTSDGEYTTTGCIAAYADGATFENIAISHCNPRVYNIGNGGIVGCVGWYAKKAGMETTFTNITVDNSNKISALWGSYDVACGGIVGQYYPTSGQSSAGKPVNGGVDLVNCHVSAVMDVYNDVCGNYQYYAYRYAGMIIGSIRENTTNDDGKTIPNMTGISATGCTVNYGDWNDYYYCEFEKNGHPSYSGPDDYKFSRVPHSELVFTDANSNGLVDADERASVTGCKHNHTDAENNRAIYLPFHQLFTGYGWGVTSIGLEKYSGITVEEFDLDIEEGTQDASVTKFTAKKSINLSGIKAGDSITVGDLFEAIADPSVTIKNDSVMVSVTDITKTGITADFTRGKSWSEGVLKFNGTNGYVTITIQDYYFCNPTSVTVVVGTFNTTDRFEKVFKNTEKYLYRLGNANEINISSLFKLKEKVADSEIGNVNVVVTDTAGNSLNVYARGTGAWNSGRIDFDDNYTGPVQITISDDKYSTPVTLSAEIVKAENYTEKVSVTAHNAVLLNDVSGSFSISNGHTLYGNGFTVNLPTSYQAGYTAGFVGYITVTNGNIDNTRIVGPVYPQMNIYQKQAQNSTTNKEEYFYNSVYINGGNCNISNSYISGSRAAVCIRGGNNVVIEDTTLFGGAVANLHIAGASTLLLKNLTTVQVDEKDSYGQNVTAHGMGVLVDSSTVDIKVEGSLKQYNWLAYDQWKAIVNEYETFFPKFYSNNQFKAYQHQRNGETYVNMTFIFACDWDSNKMNVEQQTNKDIYLKTSGVTVSEFKGGVYSVANQTNVTDEMYNAPGYESIGYNPVAPVFDFDNSANHDADDENDAADSYCEYNENDGIISIGMKGSEITLNLAGVSVKKDGKELNYTAYLNGSQINGNSVTINAANGTKQKLTFKTTLNNQGYDYSGTEIAGSVEYSWTINIDVATLSFPGPVWNIDNYVSGTTTYKVGTTNCYYVYYQTSKGYGEATPIYDGIKINYYDTTGKLVNADLSATQYEPKGKGVTQALNEAFTYTLSDGSVLKMVVTGSYKSGVSSLYFTNYNNKTYVYPADLKSDSCVRPSKTGYDFNVSIKYMFTDPNGLSTEEITINHYGAKANGNSISDVQWKTFDSDNGSSPSCVTGDTRVTLADGNTKRIDQTTYEDMLLVWNFQTGEYDVAPASIVMNHGYDNHTVTELKFADGTVVKTINGHGFFDVATNKYVIIDEHNVADYINHKFVQADGDGYKTVCLVDYSIYTEYTESWSILTAEYYNCLLENMWTLTPAEVKGSADYLMPFYIGKDMKYDAAMMQADIEKYGLYAYAEFDEYMTYEQFTALGIANFKVAVGKGYFTYEDILYLIGIHLG